MLNFERIRATRPHSDPYPYMVVEGAIEAGALDRILADFPRIEHGGSFPVSSVDCGPAFEQLLDTLDGEAFRTLVEEKFDVDLSDSPAMTTVRGVMREKDGRIHTDSKTKKITILIYFNDDWQAEGGHLRILRSGDDLEDYVEEIPPRLGTMVIFRVTDNCWHGHKPVVGKRLSLQMNYLSGGAARSKHQFFHRLSARLKNLFA